MNYKFPEITDIEQIRRAIHGRDEFIEADRGSYIVFNYMLTKSDSFNCPLRRECRGLIFGKDGKVLSRRFHKFFNLNEREETMSENVDWTREHIILEKLDGSMITPLVINDDVHWATKMGITEIGQECAEFVKRHPKYSQFALSMHEGGWTPIFEYMGPTNRVVMEYEKENLVLLALRNNISGTYACTLTVRNVARFRDIPTVKPYSGVLSNLKNETGMEGVVVRFDDGHMLKIKTDWYVAIHKAKENILWEKNVLRIILEEKMDDILPNLPKPDRDRIAEYSSVVSSAIDSIVWATEEQLDQYKNKTKKDFALGYKGDPFIRPIVFACFDGTKDIRTEVVNALLKRTNTQSDVDSIRHLLYDVNWKITGDM